MLICMRGEKEFRTLRSTTEDYIACEKAAAQLQDVSDYLTEQVRLYTMTGDKQYVTHYFTEADVNDRRETAIATLQEHFPNTSTVAALQTALENSKELSNIECYAMKLTAEAVDPGDTTLPDEVLQTELSAEDEALSADDKIAKAQQMVSDSNYDKEKAKISDKVTECTSSLIDKTRSRQARSSTIFQICI